MLIIEKLKSIENLKNEYCYPTFKALPFHWFFYTIIYIFTAVEIIPCI